MPKAKAVNSLAIPPDMLKQIVKAFVYYTVWGYLWNFHLLTGKSYVKKPSKSVMETKKCKHVTHNITLNGCWSY